MTSERSERVASTGSELVSLADAADLPSSVIGGKARALGRLREAGLPVPPGYVIPSALLEREMPPPANRSDEAGDPGVAARDGTGTSTPDPSPRLRETLSGVLRALAPSSVAVRSSAATEDGETASYAGQFDTILGVEDLEEVAGAVRRCWEAAGAEHVAAYRRAREGEAGSATRPDPEARPGSGPGDPEEGTGFAVILQRMVPAEAAGVAFTADPRTGDRNVVVVEAVAGLGEGLVSGERTPERWRVPVGETSTAREGTAGEEGRTGEGLGAGDPQREGGPERVLEPEAARRIAELALEAEEVLAGNGGRGADVEWAVAGETVHLLQARPITAGTEVAPVPVEPEPPESGFWFRDAAHFPRPFHPLFSSIYVPRYEEAVAGAFEEFGLLVEGLRIREIGGWPYSRIVPPGGKDGPAPPSWLLWLLSRLAPPLRERMARAREAMEEDRAGEHVERWWEEWRPELDGWIRRADRVDLEEVDRRELARHFDDAVETFDRALTIHFRLFPPFFLAVSDLVFFCREELGWEKGRAAELLAGRSGTSSEPGRALEELAAAAAESDAAREALADPGADVLEQLERRAPEFAREFRVYQQRYGLRVLHYDFGTPTFRERPEMVLGLVRNQLEGGDGDRADGVEELRERRIREAREALEGRPGARERFDELLERAHRAYPVREDNEFFALSVLGILRYTSLEVGRRMTAEGHLDRPDGVLFLEENEVRDWLEGPRDLTGTARRRRGERRWALANLGPPSYGEDPGPPPDPSALPDAGERVLRALLWTVDNDLQTEAPEVDALAGVGASPGSYTGPVRVVRSEEEFGKVRSGDVLVCPITSPTWSVLFPSVGALVTDAGGLLSHPAIIAREFGVPAVLATGSATEELEDGQVVTVDGATGRVEPR